MLVLMLLYRYDYTIKYSLSPLKRRNNVLGESVCLCVCPTHGHHFSLYFSRRGTGLAGQYLYHVKDHPSNGNNKGSVFSFGQHFRRKWRLKVRASDISQKLSVHNSRRGTVLAGQYLFHVKANASNGINKGSVFSCGQNFRRKGVWKWVPATLPLCKQSPFKGDTACGRMLVKTAGCGWLIGCQTDFRY